MRIILLPMLRQQWIQLLQRIIVGLTLDHKSIAYKGQHLLYDASVDGVGQTCTPKRFNKCDGILRGVHFWPFACSYVCQLEQNIKIGAGVVHVVFWVRKSNAVENPVWFWILTVYEMRRLVCAIPNILLKICVQQS